jgi:hypothetical protein
MPTKKTKTRGPYKKANPLNSRIGLRLPTGLYEKLQDLQRVNGDKSISDTIRAILDKEMTNVLS